MNTAIKLILAILLLGCLVDFPYGYYQFVRFAAMVGFGYFISTFFPNIEIPYYR